jgi:hypothetical protein
MPIDSLVPISLAEQGRQGPELPGFYGQICLGHATVPGVANGLWRQTEGLLLWAHRRHSNQGTRGASERPAQGRSGIHPGFPVHHSVYDRGKRASSGRAALRQAGISDMVARGYSKVCERGSHPGSPSLRSRIGSGQ